MGQLMDYESGFGTRNFGWEATKTRQETCTWCSEMHKFTSSPHFWVQQFHAAVGHVLFGNQHLRVCSRHVALHRMNWRNVGNGRKGNSIGPSHIHFAHFRTSCCTLEVCEGDNEHAIRGAKIEPTGGSETPRKSDITANWRSLLLYEASRFVSVITVINSWLWMFRRSGNRRGSQEKSDCQPTRSQLSLLREKLWELQY